MSILTVKHLQKRYRSRQVVKDVSLSVESGEVVGLLGPNGAGKTTSFYMILGLVNNDNGSIYINRQEISRLPIDQRAKLGLGYLPQEESVFRKLTVEENILAILETLPDLSEEKRIQRMERLLNEFHITHIRDNIGASLSGGERRRVEIARALASEPHFLLLDEPFAGVDPISVNDIQRIIRYLSDFGIGVLITDHNVRETLGICDRAYIVSEGRVLAQGTPTEILNNEKVKEVYLGDEFKI